MAEAGFRVQGSGFRICRVRETHQSQSIMVRFTHTTTHFAVQVLNPEPRTLNPLFGASAGGADER
jgi:hypothetical protein